MPRSLFFSKLLERERLNHPDSSKSTYHLKLDLTGSNITYEPGDAIAIFPSNPLPFVEKILNAMKRRGEEKIKHPRTLVPLSLKEFLIDHCNLIRITAPLLSLFPKLLFSDEKERQAFAQSHDLLTLFERCSPSKIDLQTLLSKLSPMLARFYSVASSQKKDFTSVDLLIVTFQSEQGGEMRQGLASDFLCHRAKRNKTPIRLYHHPNPRFKLPQKKELPLIMIGPGTGVAPYRAFLQERTLQKGSGKHWLFFGERSRSHDFYYRSFFEELESQNRLRLDCAFSRDQEEKTYVQHLMLKKGGEIWQWIQEGAIVYICGDAHQMAKEVTRTLSLIAMRQGTMPKGEADAYISQMRKEKRLLLDVY